MARPNNGPYLRARKRDGCMPIWEIRWHVRGKPYARSTGTGDRSLAERMLMEFRASGKAEEISGG